MNKQSLDAADKHQKIKQPRAITILENVENQRTT
jgi:hypothetical protein